jgi:DUF2934 family protein
MKPKPSPVIREKKPPATGALSGSGVAEADRGSHSRPGSDEPHEPVDIHARIANRAYELYERGGRQEGHALHDWLQAEGEIRGS